MGHAGVRRWGPTLVGGGVMGSLALIVLLSATATAPGQVGKAPPGLDHFKCYTAKTQAFKTRKVTYKDQFGSGTTAVVGARRLCNPASKDKGKIIDRRAHLVCYATRDVRPTFKATKVSVTNQFGTVQLSVTKPESLCVPSLKSLGKALPPTTPDPQKLVDHFRCYAVDPLRTPKSVALTDQFGSTDTSVLAIVRLCNPVSKNKGRIRRPRAHLVCYQIRDKQRFQAVSVNTRNQFGLLSSMRVTAPDTLCLPSFKKVVGA
jgi:hypothetical protein